MLALPAALSPLLLGIHGLDGGVVHQHPGDAGRLLGGASLQCEPLLLEALLLPLTLQRLGLRQMELLRRHDACSPRQGLRPDCDTYEHVQYRTQYQVTG